jgi:hypothetical protein
VLWIGYLQWHFRTRGHAAPSEPVLRNFANIVEQDAVLESDGWDIVWGSDGQPMSRWDGVTYTRHPVTRAEVPDERALVALRTFINPRPASWPQADFIVGNPPFIGGKDLRRELGDGYAEAVWSARKHIPGPADFVMQFWDKAATEVAAGRTRRFGFITTNSITQNFSRRVIENRLRGRNPVSLVMAIPDHPWMKSANKASVRIAMAVGAKGERDGVLYRVIHEDELNTDSPIVGFKSILGKIHADFTIGPNISNVSALLANQRLCSRGVSLHGAGFIVTPAEAAQLGLGRVEGLDRYIRPYRNGRDLASRPRDVLVIDLFSLAERDIRDRFPAVYQWVRDRVKPGRDNNNRKSYRDTWWIFGEPRRDLRLVLESIPRYIATVETAKHRWFQFLDAKVRPDNMLVTIGLDDAFFLGVLSSRIHRVWALASGGGARLGVGNDPRYTKTRCFDPFPFPQCDGAKQADIRALGERLDDHRKTVLARDKALTMTGHYNVLEKTRTGNGVTGEALTDGGLSDGERQVYEAGLVGVLASLHDDLDAAVASAYGWSASLDESEMLSRLVELNQTRAAAEQGGDVLWLRPDIQAPRDDAPVIQGAQVEARLGAPKLAVKKEPFPSALPDQVASIRKILETLDEAATPADLARRYARGRRVERQIADVLRTLAILGQAVKSGDEYQLSC